MSVKKILKKATREKSPRVSKTQEAIINRQAVGDEPKWMGKPLTNLEKATAFNWYSTCASIEDARTYLSGYFSRRKEDQLVADLARVPNSCFPRTHAWLARMEEMGADVSSSEEFIRNGAAEVVRKYAGIKVEDDEQNSAPIAPKVMPADAKLDAFIANVEDVIDRKDWSFDTYAALKGNNFPTSKVNSIADHYHPLLDEIRVAIANTDTQVYEGYKRENKKALVEQEKWLTILIDDCKKFNKSERAASLRKKKIPSVEKKMKNFAWLKESQQYKAASIDPANIIGAKKVYLFNVKYKLVTLLVGDSLDIKGKSIIGFGNDSWSTPMGRKAEEAVTTITQGNEAAVKRRLDELKKGKNNWPKPKNLVDENTLILRIVSR